MTSISLEFFPPRTPAAEQRLAKNLRPLLDLRPRFATVSYGAGGSTQGGTYDLVRRLRSEYGVDCSPHLSSIGRSKAQIAEIARQYRQLGVTRIVALRGDWPEGHQRAPDEYESSWELVAAFKQIANFEIVVGCYPEGHPDDTSCEDRYTYLERKVDAGADLAISQMFFVTRHFLDFREACAQRRMTIPVMPGIMPIHDPGQVLGFAAKCGAVISASLRQTFAERDGRDAFSAARDLVCEQALVLAREGIEHVHIYTLNRHKLTLEMCRALSDEGYFESRTSPEV